MWPFLRLLIRFLPDAWAWLFLGRATSSLPFHHHCRGQGQPRESFPPSFWLWFSSQIPQPRTWEGRMRSRSLPGSLPAVGSASWTAPEGQTCPAEPFGGRGLIQAIEISVESSRATYKRNISSVLVALLVNCTFIFNRVYSLIKK